MSNDLATTAMWTDAVRDVDADNHVRAITKATVALAGTWPFLAAAQSQEEFDHRLALMAEQIERTTPKEILGEVVANVRQRFTQLHEGRLVSGLEARTAARQIQAADGVQSLPQAYVHLHHHAAGGEDGSEYWQVDHVASPTTLRTLGHQEDRDAALQMAREAALPNGLPIFENGKHVEGHKLSLPQPGSEILDARTGRWVKVAHQSWAPGGNALHPGAGIYDERARARRAANWGSSLSPRTAEYTHVVRSQFGHDTDPVNHFVGSAEEGEAVRQQHLNNGARDSHVFPMATHNYYHPGDRTAAYQPDADAQWRYHYPDAPQAPSQGGQPTAPSPMGVGVSNQVGQTSVGPDGFPLDVAQGEDRSTAAIEYQTTPGQWVAPPGGWPAGEMPNAATGLPVGQRRTASSDANVARLPECDIHKYVHGQTGVPAAYDGKTSSGPWANMCEDCFKSHGIGLGDGRGQRLHVQSSKGHNSDKNGRPVDIDALRSIERRDPNAGERQPTQADYDAHRDWAVRTHGQPAWDTYNKGGWDQPNNGRNDPHGTYASRRTATEGAAPTPGANPHFFEQGTQGLQGPAQFPENPSSAIEPKPAGPADEFYGTVPPQVSSGSASDGTSDGGGYSHQAKLSMRRVRGGFAVDLADGRDTFEVGRWSDRRTAVREGESYRAEYLRRRLGFSRGAGERTAASDNEVRPGAVFHRASPTALNEAYHVQETNETDGRDSGFIAGSGGIHVHDYPLAISELQNNWQIHDDNLQDEWNPDKKRDSGRRREVGKLLDSLRAAHPGPKPVANEYYDSTPRMGSFQGDYEEGRDHGQAGLDLGAVYSQPSGRYIEGHEQGSSERPGMHPDDRDWVETQVRQRHGGRLDEHIQRALQGPFTETTPDDHRARGHYDAQMGRPYAGEEHQDSERARAYRDGWDGFHNQRRGNYVDPPTWEEAERDEYETMSPDEQREYDHQYGPYGGKRPRRGPLRTTPKHSSAPDPERDEARDREIDSVEKWVASMSPEERSQRLQGNWPPKQASTDGRIVGKCDHCQQPVRYHTEDGGHLQHLHNGSHRCADGRVATAAVVAMDGFEARVKVSPFVTTGAVLENPTAENPTGKGSDPYRAKTQWEGFESQRPRQMLEGNGGMNANTPTTAGDPIRTGPNANTPIPGADLDEDGPRERGDQDEEDE